MTPLVLQSSLLAAALLAGRAEFLGLSVALAAAGYSSVRAAKPRLAPVVAVGLLLGQASTGDSWTTLRLALVLLALTATAKWPAIRASSGARGGWAIAASGLVALATLVSWLPGAMLAGLSSHELVLGLVEAMAALLASLVLQAGIPELMAGGRPDLLQSRAMLSLVLIIGAALAGLSGLGIFGVSLTGVVGSLTIMLLARAGGGAVGAIAGVAVGLVGSISGDLSGAYIGVYAVAGMLAGIAGDLGTLGAVAGFVLGLGCLGSVITDVRYLGTSVVQSVAAGTALVLVPSRWVSRARLVCRGPDASDEGTQMSSALWLLATARLSVLAHVFAELSQAFAEPAVAATAVSMGQLATISPSGQPGHVTPAATEARRLLSRQLAGVSGITADLADRMALGNIPAGLLRAREVEDALRQAGGDIKQAVIAPAEHGFEIHVETKGAGPEGCDWCTALACEVAQPVVGRRLHLAKRQCELPGSGCYFVLATEPRWALRVGQSRRPHSGELVSGDSHISRRVGGHRHLLLLSDGMGTGLAAARESITAVRMVEAMLDAGFALEPTLHTINTALLLRCPQEAFTTIDLALLDLAGGRLDLVKVGACPSYLYREGKVSMLQAKAPPLGILEGIDIQRLTAVMRPGDTLVMVSDGLFGGRAGLPRRQDWLARAISRHAPSTSPQQLADLIVESAVHRTRSQRQDDMTVLVAALRRRGASG